MADPVLATTFNLMEDQKAERKLLVTAVNVGSSAIPEWEIIGVGVEDSSIEYNPETQTVTDILGITETTVKKLETSQSLEPMTVRGGSALALRLYNILKYQALSALAMFDVMQIHAYVGKAGAYDAEVHHGCTITPKSLGGDATVDMPIDISFSNNKTHGTVNDYTYDGEAIKFTETTNPST